MAHSRSQHPTSPTSRPAFVAARLGLLTLVIMLAVTAGCGGSGSKPASEPAGAAAVSPEPATPVPVVVDSVETPVPGGGSAPSAPAPTPSAPTPSAALGAQVFAKRCALCHGADGHGDGIASKGLNPKPRNFHDVAYMSTRTDAQLLEIIHKGKGVMPKWGGQLSEAEITAVLKHVRSLAK